VCNIDSSFSFSCGVSGQKIAKHLPDLDLLHDADEEVQAPERDAAPLLQAGLFDQ